MNLCIIQVSDGPIAQLGARLNGIEEAEGSNPSGSTQKQVLRDLLFYWWYNKKNYGGVVGRPLETWLLWCKTKKGTRKPNKTELAPTPQGICPGELK